MGYPQVDAERGIWGKWFISCKMIPGEMAGQGESEESKGRKPHGVWVKGVYPVPTGVPTVIPTEKQGGWAMVCQSHPSSAEGPGKTSGPGSQEASGRVHGVHYSAISWSKSPLSH